MTSFEPIDPMFQSERPLLALRPGIKEGFLARVVKRLSGGRIATPGATAFALVVVACIMIVLTIVVIVSSRDSTSENDRGIEQHGGRTPR